MNTAIKRLLTVFLVFTFGMTVSGEKYSKKMKIGSVHGMEYFQKMVGLDDSQVKKIRVIKLEVEKVNEANRHTIVETKISIRESAVKGDLTRKQILKSIRRLQEAAQKKVVANFEAKSAIVKILTDEQIKKLGEHGAVKLVLGSRKGFHGGKSMPKMRGRSDHKWKEKH